MAKRATRTAPKTGIRAVMDAQKTGRLAAKAISEGAEIICPRCGKHSKNILKDYYASVSPIFAYSKSMPICRECARELLDGYIADFGDNVLGVQRFCQAMDVYFDPECAAEVKDSNDLTSYLKKASGGYLSSNRRGFTESIQEGKVITSIDDPSDRGGIAKKVIRRWGLGYIPEQYNWLQDEYDDWCARYEITGDKSLEILVTNIVKTELEMQEATQTGADMGKLTTRLNTLLGSAKLKPVQNASSEDDAIYPFGVEIGKIENDMPIDPDPQFQDVDGVLKYIQIFSGHIAKMFGKPNRYSDIYEKEMGKYTVMPPSYEEDGDAGPEELFADGE